MLDSNVSTYIDKDGNVQEVGGGGVDATTLNGVITGSNGITTALNSTEDKIEIGLPVNLTVESISISGSPYYKQYIKFQPTGTGVLGGEYRFYTDVPQYSENYWSFEGYYVVGSSTPTSKTLYYDGPLGNVKTVLGQSIYGSGDITAAFNTSYFTLQSNNSSGGTVTVKSGTNKTGSYDLTLPSKETGIIGIAPYLIMKDGLTGRTQAVTVSSGSEQYFSNTKCTLVSGYSYLFVGWVDCTVGDASNIMAANIRVFSKDGTTKRFERGCRTTLHSGGGCMVVAFYRCENDGDWVRLNTYNYRSSSTTFNGSLSVYRFVEEN